MERSVCSSFFLLKNYFLAADCMFMEHSVCHEVITGWPGWVKAVSNRGKWEVMEHILVYMVSGYIKKKNSTGRKSQRKTGRHSGSFSYIRQSLYSGWLCAHSVCAHTDLPLKVDIHYLRFPGAIKPAVQQNNGLFLLCFLQNSLTLVCMGACMRLYSNRTGPLHPTELHVGVNRRFAAQSLGLKSWVSTMKQDTVQRGSREAKRTSRGREREAASSTRCAHLLASENYECTRLHAAHTCWSSLSLSVCSRRARSSLCADARAHRLFSSWRSAIIYQTYSPKKGLYNMMRRDIQGLVLLSACTAEPPFHYKFSTAHPETRQ